MDPSDLQRAVEAGSSTASALGLRVNDAVVVHNSNRVVVRLTPCDVLARVRPLVHQTAHDIEVEVARRLTETGSPVAELEPRVEPYMGDDHDVALATRRPAPQRALLANRGAQSDSGRINWPTTGCSGRPRGLGEMSGN